MVKKVKIKISINLSVGNHFFTFLYAYSNIPEVMGEVPAIVQDPLQPEEVQQQYSINPTSIWKTSGKILSYTISIAFHRIRVKLKILKKSLHHTNAQLGSYHANVVVVIILGNLNLMTWCIILLE